MSTSDASAAKPQLPPNYDIKHVSKVHFIIFARRFVEDFAEYFDDCETVQSVKFKFMAAFGDVPTALDPDSFTELLYNFTEIGDQYVTAMLDNFGKMVRPYKPYIEQRDANVWATLAALPEAQKDNLVRDLCIAELWGECDANTHEIIWEYVETLLYYGTMYTTYTVIPDSLMAELNKCALGVIQEKASSGMPLTEENVQKSLSDIAPKILSSMKQEDIMNFGMKMLNNPNMMQDLMGMAKNVQAAMPGLNTQEVMENMMPGGVEGMQSMMSALGAGGDDGQMPAINAEMFTQVQSMISDMMGGGAPQEVAEIVD
jgi:hypothetical protein